MCACLSRHMREQMRHVLSLSPRTTNRAINHHRCAADQCRRSICGDSYTLVRLYMPAAQVCVTAHPGATLVRQQHLRFPQSHLSPLLTVSTAMLSLWVTNCRGRRGTAGDKDKSICASNLLYMEWWNRGEHKGAGKPRR